MLAGDVAGLGQVVGAVVHVRGHWVLAGDCQALALRTIVASLELDLHQVTADVDRVTRYQRARLGQALPVHPRAVTAAQVLELNAVAVDTNRRVLARDLRAAQDDRTV